MVFGCKRTNVVLLAGGQGTRVRALHPHVPKPFIPCGGRPFIEWVVDYFRGQGLASFVISLGHLADVAEKLLPPGTDSGAEVITVREPEPLGTGGALLHAVTAVPPCDVVVCANADSLVLASLAPVWQALEDPAWDGAILGVTVDDASRYGSLKLDSNGTLRSFGEKESGSGVINAGVYFFRADILNAFPVTRPLSLEKEVFPHLLSLGVRLLVHTTDAPFLDIGTPESLRGADWFIQQHVLAVANP